MGRWSNHPMGSDAALDARDTFMGRFDLKTNLGDEICYFERPKEEIRDALLALTLDELKEMADKDLVCDDKYVIPYTFIEYEAYPTDPAIKKYLYGCLDEHYSADFEEGIQHIKLFKKNFDDIISGKKILTEDLGLMATIATKMNGEPEPNYCTLIDNENN